MDMKSALIERVADTLPHQGKALAAMEQMAN